MILDNTTSVEMLTEILAENREVQARIDRYALTQLVPLHRKKQLKMPCVKWIDFTTKRNNHYYIRLMIRTVDDVKWPHYTQYIVFESEVGKKALLPLFMQSDMPHFVVEFEPHLFKRYSERMGIEKHGVELIKDFFHNNAELYRMEEFCRKGGTERDLMLACHDGAVFGERHDEYGVILKTFIDTDSMGGPRALLNARYNDLVEQCRKDYEAEYFVGKR